jgi:hypothetical protein
VPPNSSVGRPSEGQRPSCWTDARRRRPARSVPALLRKATARHQGTGRPTQARQRSLSLRARRRYHGYDVMMPGH